MRLSCKLAKQQTQIHASLIRMKRANVQNWLICIWPTWHTNMRAASTVQIAMIRTQIAFHPYPMMQIVRSSFVDCVCFCCVLMPEFLLFPVFLTEVIDSLERGFKEKTKPDYLILEINSSRYAYNMSLSEVNFYVVKALLNLYPIKEADGNVLSAFNQIFAALNGVLKNYIRGADAMGDCLKAIEVCFFSFDAVFFLAQFHVHSHTHFNRR